MEKYFKLKEKDDKSTDESNFTFNILQNKNSLE